MSRIATYALALGFLLAACSPPDKAQWPRVRVLLDPASRVFLTDYILNEFPRSEGVFLDLDIQPAGTIPELLAKGAPADVVLISDAEAWAGLARKGLIAEPPWRFEYHRQTILMIAKADSADLQPIAIPNPAQTVAGRLAERALKQAGIWAAHQPSLIMCSDEAGALAAVSSGRARSAAVLSDSEPDPSRLRVSLRLDPYPDLPACAAGAVVARPGVNPLARRAWAFLERAVNRAEEGFTPTKVKK